MKKTFKFFSLAALAFCVALSFTSCGDPAEGEGEGGGEPEVPAEPVLLTETFDNGIPSTWTNIDQDGDGYTWAITSQVVGNALGFSGEGVASQSYDNQVGALTPNNYLVSPEITITHKGYNLSYYVGASDADWYQENYSVLVGTLNGNTFTPLGTLTTEVLQSANFNQKTFNLDAYKGQTVRIAFRHHDITDQFNMIIDQVEVKQAQ